MTKLVDPMARIKARMQETATIADDMARSANVRAKLRDADGKLIEVRVDPRNRICLPLTA